MIILLQFNGALVFSDVICENASDAISKKGGSSPICHARGISASMLGYSGRYHAHSIPSLSISQCIVIPHVTSDTQRCLATRDGRSPNNDLHFISWLASGSFHPIIG